MHWKLLCVVAVCVAALGCDEINRLIDAAQGQNQAPPVEKTSEEPKKDPSAVGTDKNTPEKKPTEAAKAPKDPDGTLVDKPPEGSPEAIIQVVIEAAMEKDEDKGWQKLKAVLHSDNLKPQALQSWRISIYNATRRKIWLYVKDKNSASFKVTKKETLKNGQVKIYVHNRESIPTPCTVKRDPAAGGAWRVISCSL